MTNAGGVSKTSAMTPWRACRLIVAAFVREACAGDELLRAEVESLLANQSRADALGSD